MPTLAELTARELGYSIGTPQPGAQAQPAAAPPAPPPPAPPPSPPAAPAVAPAPVVPPTPLQGLNFGGLVGDLMQPSQAIPEPQVGAAPTTSTGIEYVTNMDEIIKRSGGAISRDIIDSNLAIAQEGAKNAVGETVTEMVDKYYPPGTLDRIRADYGGNPYLYGMALNSLVRNIGDVREARHAELRSDVAIETARQNWGRLGIDQQNAFTNWFNVTNAALQGEKQLKLQESLGQWNLAQNWASIQVAKYNADIQKARLPIDKAQIAVQMLVAGMKFDANGNPISGGGAGNKGATSPKEMIDAVTQVAQLMRAWQEADKDEDKTILLGALTASVAALEQYTDDPHRILTKLVTGAALGDAGVMPMLVDLTASNKALQPYVQNLYHEDPTKREEARAMLWRHGRAYFQKEVEKLYPGDDRKQQKLLLEFSSIIAGDYLKPSGIPPVAAGGPSSGYDKANPILWLFRNFPKLRIQSPVTVDRYDRTK